VLGECARGPVHHDDHAVGAKPRRQVSGRREALARGDAEA
jgi:hypothetical protein